MTITQEQFDGLLAWLGSDRDAAGRRYEDIRSSLVRLFISKGFIDAEDLADETINRVMVRLPQIKNSYVGEPACYFKGVARNVIRESLRRREVQGRDIEIWCTPNLDAIEEEHDCLGHCLDRLTMNKRKLILDYYLHEGPRKIEHHKRMAGKLHITVGAVRSRAYQIRLKLEHWMQRCDLKNDYREIRETCMVGASAPMTRQRNHRSRSLN